MRYTAAVEYLGGGGPGSESTVTCVSNCGVAPPVTLGGSRYGEAEHGIKPTRSGAPENMGGER